MIRVLVVLLFILTGSQAFTQNLVYNGSFEEYTDCCKRYGEIEAAKGWYEPTGSSTDYYNSCCIYDDNLGTPKNDKGYQVAKDGVAYAGLVFYSQKDYKDSFYYREYLQTKLLSKLNAGQIYQVIFYISLPEQSKYYGNLISACFSKKEEMKSVKAPLPLASAENKITYMLNSSKAKDTTNWVEVKMNYTAKGGEEYLVIGTFNEDITKCMWRKMLRKNVVNSSGLNCYYFIDDISVIPLTNNNTLGR